MILFIADKQIWSFLLIDSKYISNGNFTKKDFVRPHRGRYERKGQFVPQASHGVNISLNPSGVGYAVFI